jgi:ArsR family transcriptional regulator, lead/cadmium/zinc/bismuth-responsive transcriptional repressor
LYGKRIDKIMISLLSQISEQQAQDLAELFRALSDPTRLRILSTLLETELSVQDIAARVEMSHSAVSHQLGSLRQMRIVRAQKRGRQVFYALDDNHVTDLLQRGFDHILHG